MQLSFWRRTPRTHDRIGLDATGIAIRTSWVLAGIALFAWVWSRV